MRILTGIVLYNSNIERLQENIESIIQQTDKIVCVDNGSKNIEDIKNLIHTYQGIDLIENGINLGIAAALKIIMQYANEHKFKWVLSLDQDSVCNKDLIMIYKKYISYPDIGILTCNIKDRNFDSKAVCSKDEMYREINFCITSASLMSVDAYNHTNGYDEKMFIDGVDFDICIQIRKAGYKILRINYDGILHEVGHGKSVTILGKKYEIYNHLPFRQYFMARNRFYLVKKYSGEYKYGKEILREFRDWYLIVKYEKNKYKKIRARISGLIDSLRM